MATKKTPAKRRGKTVTAKSRVKKTIARKRGKAGAVLTIVRAGEKLRNRRNTKGKKPMSAAAAVRQVADLREIGRMLERARKSLEQLRTGR
jgi:hypothetical protein